MVPAACAWSGIVSFVMVPLNRIRKPAAKSYTGHYGCLPTSALACWTSGISGSASFQRVEEVLVDGGRFRAISGSRQRSGQLETRHGSDRIVQHDSRMIENLLKLSRRLAMTAHPGISKATHVDRIESSEEGAGVKRCARNSEVVRSRRLVSFRALSPGRPG